jgi:hypothetical protein
VIVEGAKADAKTVIPMESVALSIASFELESTYASLVTMLVVAGLGWVEVFG